MRSCCSPSRIAWRRVLASYWRRRPRRVVTPRRVLTTRADRPSREGVCYGSANIALYGRIARLGEGGVSDRRAQRTSAFTHAMRMAWRRMNGSLDEYAKMRRPSGQLGLNERAPIVFFNGGHSIHRPGTFDFLQRHLDWPRRASSRGRATSNGLLGCSTHDRIAGARRPRVLGADRRIRRMKRKLGEHSRVGAPARSQRP